MQWFKNIWRALQIEPEIWAVYMLGQKSADIPHKMDIKQRYPGLPLRLVAFVWRVLKTLRFTRSNCQVSSTDILVFAKTANQANALSATVEALDQQGVSLIRISGAGATRVSSEFNNDKCERIALSIADALKVMILTLVRAPVIWRSLANKDLRLRRWFFDSFLRCHIYLVYFEKILASNRPNLVLVNNDHNAPHRCLLALARSSGIKTAYMQHASVSPLFPTLAFDYNLLDGVVAADTYLACEGNNPATGLLPLKRHVFLTGQKKPLKRGRNMTSNRIGMAVNALDALTDIQNAVQAVTQAGYSVRLRWHPGMGATIINEIKASFSDSVSVSLSDPVKETVDDFLKQVCMLIAGNSSIHLESAVAGVMPLYYEFSPVHTPDYYGYVKNGVSASASGVEQLIAEIIEVLEGRCKADTVAIQRYSATFNTEWEGREGELAAGILKGLVIGDDPSEFWGYAGTVIPPKNDRGDKWNFVPY